MSVKKKKITHYFNELDFEINLQLQCIMGCTISDLIQVKYRVRSGAMALYVLINMISLGYLLFELRSFTRGLFRSYNRERSMLR